MIHASGLRLARHVLGGTSAPGDIAADQDARLRRLVAHAYANVPFYREWLDRAGVQPRHIRGSADLVRIPPVSRADLQSEPAERVVARGLDPARLLVIRTSGSTGEPLRIRRTHAEKLLLGALQYRGWMRLGLRPRDRRVKVSYARPGHRRSPLARSLGLTRLFRAERLSCTRPPAEVLADLERLKPDVLTGFPSALAQVAALAEARGTGVRPRLVFLSGEVASPPLRRQIAAGFRAPIRDVYTSHEGHLMAYECAETGELHVHQEGAVVEVLDGERPVAPGETGEVVVTSLHSFAMPFIRYRQGDRVRRGGDRCPCRAPYPTLAGIEGRMLDLFVLPGGRHLHPYQLLTALMNEGEHWVQRYELVQERADAIVLRFIPTSRVPADAERRLVAAGERLLGAEVAFRAERVGEIPLGPTGKGRHIRSAVT